MSKLSLRVTMETTEAGIESTSHPQLVFFALHWPLLLNNWTKGQYHRGSNHCEYECGIKRTKANFCQEVSNGGDSWGCHLVPMSRRLVKEPLITAFSIVNTENNAVAQCPPFPAWVIPSSLVSAYDNISFSFSANSPVLLQLSWAEGWREARMQTPSVWLEILATIYYLRKTELVHICTKPPKTAAAPGPCPLINLGDSPYVLKSTNRAKVKMVVTTEPSPVFPHFMSITFGFSYSPWPQLTWQGGLEAAWKITPEDCRDLATWSSQARK